MSFAWCSEAQTTGCEESSVGGAERADGDTQWHDPSEDAEDSISERNRNRFRLNHLARRHGGKVGDVDERVAEGDKGDRNHDGSWEIPDKREFG